MAEVYRAVDEQLGRTVAVKLILPHHAALTDFRERFLREARLVAALDHPNILPVFDFGEQEETPFLVMPLIDGGTLADRMGGDGFPPAEVAAWIGQLAAALDAAHAAGILHRDVKPSNVLLARDGRAVLADFGIAKSLEASAALTATGSVVGTPAYMAPELARGEASSPASDLYALAVVAYELLAGRPPFAGESALAILHRHATEPVPPLGGKLRDLPPGVDRVVARALAKEPAARFPSCTAFASELAAAVRGEATVATERSSLAAPPTVVLPGGPGRAALSAAPRAGVPRWLIWVGLGAAAVALAVAVALGLGVARWQELGGGEPVGSPATPDSTPAAPAPASSPSPHEVASVASLPSLSTPTAPALASPTPARVAAAGGDPADRGGPEGSPAREADPAPAVAAEPAERGRERATGALRPIRRLTAADFAALADGSALAAVGARPEFEPGLARAVASFGAGGARLIAGDAAGARQALATAAGLAGAAQPVAFPLLLLGRPQSEEMALWQLAFAFGDPRGEAADLLAAARATGEVTEMEGVYAAAVLRRWQGDHHGAAALLAPQVASAAGGGGTERAQFAQLLGEELVLAGEAEPAARAFAQAVADGGSQGGLLAAEAAELLGRRLGRRDLAAPFIEQACARGVVRFCGDLRGTAQRRLLERRPILPPRPRPR